MKGLKREDRQEGACLIVYVRFPDLRAANLTTAFGSQVILEAATADSVLSGYALTKISKFLFPLALTTLKYGVCVYSQRRMNNLRFSA